MSTLDYLSVLTYTETMTSATHEHDDWHDGYCSACCEIQQCLACRERDAEPVEPNCPVCGGHCGNDGDCYDEPQSCGICDGYGHGYPGAGPCPLEMRGRCECGGQQAADGSGCLCGGS